MQIALGSPDKTRIEAKDAIKGKDYACPNCAEKVIFAKGNKYRWHFKHAKGSACAYGGETWQHEEAKFSILEGTRPRNLMATPEWPVLSIEGDRRADVVVWAPQTDPPKDEDRRRLAFEVQYSAIDFDALAVRTQAYMAAGVPMIWIPVVDVSKFKFVQSLVGLALFRVAGYSAPVWIEAMKSIHGHLWIYVPQTKAFWRGWLLDHWLYKNPSEGYDADGNQHSSGGYWYQAMRKRDLYLEGPFEFRSLKIVRIDHSKNKLVSPKGQKRFLVNLVPDGEGKRPICPVEKWKKAHVVDGMDTGFYSYADWVRIGCDWQEAGFDSCEALPTLNNP